MLLDTNVKAARMVDAFKTLRSPQNSHGFSRINHSFRVRLCGLVLRTNSRQECLKPQVLSVIQICYRGSLHHYRFESRRILHRERHVF